MTDRADYVRRVVDRLEAMLRERRSALPAQFGVVRVHGTQSDWRLEIEIDGENDEGKWFQAEEVLNKIAKDLNAEFQGDNWYHGIQVFVPDRFLGPLGLQHLRDRLEQERVNESNRQVRLGKYNG